MTIYCHQTELGRDSQLTVYCHQTELVGHSDYILPSDRKGLNLCAKQNYVFDQVNLHSKVLRKIVSQLVENLQLK